MTFLNIDGTVKEQIPLDDDPSLVKEVALSTNGRFVAVGTSFKSSILLPPGELEKADGGESPMSVQVYDHTAMPLYSVTGTSADDIIVSNGGATVLRHQFTGEMAFASRTSTEPTTRFQFLGSYGSGLPKVAVSAAGDAVLVAAERHRIAGGVSRGISEHISIVATSSLEIVVGLFSKDGHLVWQRHLPEINCIDSVGLSDEGDLAVVAGAQFERASTPTGGGIFKTIRTYLFDAQGKTLGESSLWWGGRGGIAYRADLNAFMLGNARTVPTVILGRDRSSTYLRPPRSDAIGAFKIVSRSVSKRFVAYVLSTKSRVLLLLVDRCGAVLCDRNLGGDFKRNDGRPLDDDDDGKDKSDDMSKRQRGSSKPKVKRRAGPGSELRDRLLSIGVEVWLASDENQVSVRVGDTIQTYEIVVRPKVNNIRSRESRE